MDQEKLETVINAINIFSSAFECSDNDVIDCMIGIIISEEEAGEIREAIRKGK